MSIVNGMGVRCGTVGSSEDCGEMEPHPERAASSLQQSMVTRWEQGLVLSDFLFFNKSQKSTFLCEIA